MSDSEFRRSLTPPYARLNPDRDPRDALIDLLTTQLGNARLELHRQAVRLAQLYEIEEVAHLQLKT